MQKIDKVWLDHLFIFATIFFTAYGQIVMKWQSSNIGAIPSETSERLAFVVRLFLNPWILTVLASALLGMLSWMIALSRFRLNYAYPFYSLIFVIVLLLSSVLFHESLNLPKIIGMGFIVAGIILIGRG